MRRFLDNVVGFSLALLMALTVLAVLATVAPFAWWGVTWAFEFIDNLLVYPWETFDSCMERVNSEYACEQYK